jgi:dihydroflavonol-4-reductase
MNVVDVRDVARGHLLAAEHGMAGRRYLLAGENRTFSEFLALLGDVSGTRPRLAPRIPWWVLGALASLGECRAWLTGRQPWPCLQDVRLSRYSWFYDSQRAANELGYWYRPLAETLADAYRWAVGDGLPSLRGLNRWWMRPRADRPQAA